jgi:class 3 adenylate cyclase/tetratricopeptide (TPR) repeat protein
MSVDTRRCDSCGFENVPAAKFCANCGRPVAAPGAGETGPILTAETRKIITAIFADLVGSTALTERLDPEEARGVVGKFYDAVQQAVERFEGTVANFLGDAVLAVFGLPTSHEDDPERAVRAGMAMRDAMPDLNDRLAAEHGVRLQIRVGINTGEAVAASGSTFDRDFLISDAVTTAARIQQTMMPGSVAVGERTHGLTRDVIEYRELPPLAVKGKADSLRVWEAVAPLAERSETSHIAAPLIGRRGELNLMRQLYERSCAEGLVHLVTVLGQPGVGTSRLLRELLAELREAHPSPLILRGRSLAFGGQIGYHALLDILRATVGLLDTDPPEVVKEKLFRWLHESLPGQERLVDGLLLTFGASNGPGANPEQLRAELFATWRSLLVGLAMRRPVIAVFEDVHWADDGLLDLITSMLTGMEDTSLLLICLGRPELLERRSAWASGGRNAITIDLRPLRPQETAQLVDALGQARLAPEVRQAVAQRAEGNPLFAEELVRMLTEGAPAAAAGTGVTIPDTVQAVLTARIDRLPPEERRALQAAAVIGRTFWPSAVAQLTGLSPGDTARAIDVLIGKELVAVRPQSAIAGEQEYAIRQSLTRDVAYGMLPRSQRQRAHAEAARWLEARLGDRVEEVIEIVAEHLRLAGDDARAAESLRRAASKARRLYANADAIRLFGQAIESAEKAQMDALTPQLHLGRGEVHQLMGAYTDALADFAAGLTAARRTGDRGLEAALENRVGLIHHRETRFEEAEVHFTQAAAIARESGDKMTLGLSLVDLATLSWDRGDMTAANRILTEGIALLRESGDRSSLARALNLRCMANLALGHSAEAIAAAEEALTTAREAGDKSREATSLSYLSVVHNWSGRSRLGTEYANAAIALAESIGDRRRATYAREFLAQAHQDLGEWGEGIRLTLEFLPEARHLTPLELPFVYLFLGQMYYEIGDFTRAREAFRTGASFEVRSLGWELVALLSALYLAGLDADHDVLHRTLNRLVALRPVTFAPVVGMVALPFGEAFWEAGRVEDVRTLVARYGPRILQFGGPAYIAGLAVLEARLAFIDGKRDDAAAHLDRAVELAESCEHAAVIRKARELRLQFLGRDEDREGLRRLHARIAASLPDDLRETFLHSPRVSGL